ncbi:papain-like cysteine protease family protein [Methylobacterium sp. E-065]|uniref:papain-like cysteine protease family protein n=1 Tax=Methylobacterium sp. E-065 TaxID=2836583 RepID=UPI00391B3055
MQPQSQSNWCWAAVAASIAAYFDRYTQQTQCLIAGAQLHRKNCCGADANGPCNVYGFLASALHRVRHLQAWYPSVAASFTDVQAELDGGRPLCARVAWSSGGAHFITIIGYLPDSSALAGSQLIAIEDPLWGHSDVPYEVLRTGYLQDGCWTDSYFTKE